MKTYAVWVAKIRLSQILRDVERGESALIARAGRPVARLLPLDASHPRQFGTMAFAVPVDFDAPLPSDKLALWA